MTGLMTRAEAAGLDWARVQSMDDAALEALLYARTEKKADMRPAPDPKYIHAEHSRPGVTLELLHLEYLEKNLGGYRCTQFCDSITVG